MKIVYLAGPYRSATEYGRAQNIENAKAAAIELWRMGYAVICPHLNSAYFIDGELLTDTQLLDGYLAIVERVDMLVLLPGWTLSEGSKLEFFHAKEKGIPIYLWPFMKELKEVPYP